MNFYSLLKRIKKRQPGFECGGVRITFSYDIRFNNFAISVVNYTENCKKSIIMDAFDLEQIKNDEQRNQIIEDTIKNLIYDVTEGDVKL